MPRKNTQANVEHTVAPGRAVIAVARHTWGRGPTLDEARKQVQREGATRGGLIIFYDVPEGAVVDGMGSFCYWPPEGTDWDKLEAETGKSPSDWAAIREVARGKVGSTKYSPPEAHAGA